ncbi:putative formin 2 [Cryptosporidium felis]|nr:putative formin 2 [Cryptosporidium felis]
MITELVSKILGGSGSRHNYIPELEEDPDPKVSEEQYIYCASSLTTFYRPKRLKIAILDHIPCNLESLSIELFTIQKSGNFKEYILSNIHEIKKSRVPRRTLIMNGFSFYSVISSSKILNCSECGSRICSSLVVDFTRNADNGESTYLIFQGEMILRLCDRKTGLTVYSLARGDTPDDIIEITRDDAILIIPGSFDLSESFKLGLILYSAIGWTRQSENLNGNLNSGLPSNFKTPNDGINRNLNSFSISQSHKLSICSDSQEFKGSDSETVGLSNSSEGDFRKKIEDSNKPKCVQERSTVSSEPSTESKAGNSHLVALLKAKAPPLPLHMKSGARSKPSPLKVLGKNGSEQGEKKKVLPLGRRIHWKPLSEEAAQKTIFREILYTSLSSHQQSPPMSPNNSNTNATQSPTSSVEDIYSHVLNNSTTGPNSPTSAPVSPAAITDLHMANTLVHMETLSRIFTKSGISGQNRTGNCLSSNRQNGNVLDVQTINTPIESSKKVPVDCLSESIPYDQNRMVNSINRPNSPKGNNAIVSSKPLKDDQNGQCTTLSMQKQLPLTFLSQKRAQNMAIVLARLSVPTDYIIEILKSFNMSSLTLEDYERIEQVLPTELELEVIKNNSKKELHQLEQFLSRFSHISNPTTRLRFLKFEHILDASEFDIQKNLNILYSASIQIRNSSKLRLILKAFLLLGNYVNHGISFSTMSNISSISHVTTNGSLNWSLLETKGFSVSSLLRLVEFKTVIDPSFTALHYIVANLSLANPTLNLMQLPGDLHVVSDASKISVEALFSYINDMRKELAILEVEKQKFTNDRVEYLFESYSRRLDALVESYHRIVEKVVETALYFGQSMPEGNRASVIQPFFETMNIFLLQFSSCCKEIRERPSRFTPLLIDSSLVFPAERNFSSFNSNQSLTSKPNSTNSSSTLSTPILNSSPNNSLVNISGFLETEPHPGEAEVLGEKKEVQQEDSNSKGVVSREPFSNSIMNLKKKEICNTPVVIQSLRTNTAPQLPNRPPPPLPPLIQTPVRKASALHKI